nr:hypothetical protein [uncultured Fluviicola sp.]
MSTNANQILERIKGVRQFQPSAIRNSIAMWFLQLLSFFGAIGCIIASIAILAISVSENTNLSEDELMLTCMLLSFALLLLLILKLTKMVRRRNAYILEMNEVLDGE